jgi:hypothetical protein
MRAAAPVAGVPPPLLLPSRPAWCCWWCWAVPTLRQRLLLLPVALRSHRRSWVGEGVGAAPRSAAAAPPLWGAAGPGRLLLLLLLLPVAAATRCHQGAGVGARLAGQQAVLLLPALVDHTEQHTRQRTRGPARSSCGSCSQAPAAAAAAAAGGSPVVGRRSPGSPRAAAPSRWRTRVCLRNSSSTQCVARCRVRVPASGCQARPANPHSVWTPQGSPQVRAGPAWASVAGRAARAAAKDACCCFCRRWSG